MPESADRILRRAGRHGPAGAALESGGRGIAAAVHETPENRWVGWGENLRPLKRTPTPADISSRRVMHAVGRASTRLAESLLAGVCPFPYEVVYLAVNRVDDAIVLSRYAVADSAAQKLYGGFRHAVHVRIDHPLGPLDVFTTHLASESDGGNQPCGALGACPAECVREGAATVRDCQATQLAAWVTTVHGEVPVPAFVTGDFNRSPGSFVYTRFTNRGLVDTYLAAGNPECEPASGVGCTSGRQDEDLSQLEDPASNEHERIDFLFEVPPAVRRCRLDGPDDADHDGTGTRLFTDRPNPFAPTCGPAPAAICWPSDHIGVEADLDCG